MNKQINLSWELGFSVSREKMPKEWIPATVPGIVQLDVAKHLNLPPLYEHDTVRLLDPYEDLWAIYRAVLPESKDVDELWLKGEGIDYAYQVQLNDTLLYETEGMFSSFSIALDKGWKETENILYIYILPPPKKENETGRSQAANSCKPPVCYGWDFHPRLVVRGIWKDLQLIEKRKPEFSCLRINTMLDESLAEGICKLEAQIDAIDEEKLYLEWEMIDPANHEIFSERCNVRNHMVKTETLLKNPCLWWPNELGRQDLYEIKARLYLADELLEEQTVKRGFRRIKLVSEPGYMPEEVQQPQTRELPPLTFEINGRPIFAKGTNWVCPTMFPSELSYDLYSSQLRLIQEAHMNMVRCWGGAVVNKKEFYELCDELGLLVWQEFPLACNNYPDDASYLRVLDRESEAIIQMVRDHACLALWCGGNELYNCWSGMNDQSLALRILNKNCLILDPGTPFLPTSPIMGMAHGSYVFRNKEGEDVFQIMNRMQYRAYPEFGCPGAADEELLHCLIPDSEWDHVETGGCWELHHAVNSWSEEAWLMKSVIRHYFPEATSTSEIVKYSRFLQGVGYQAIFEEARRQAPHCSMALNWCFNEPWPTAANNSILCGNGEKKPAYDNVCRALRKNMVSIRFERFDHTSKYPIRAEIFVLTDEPMPLHGEIRISIMQGEHKIEECTVPVRRKGGDVSNYIDTVFLPTEALNDGLFCVESEYISKSTEEKTVESSSYELLLNNKLLE